MQTTNQLDYDLRAFKRLYANSLRVDLPWPQLETQQGTIDWPKIDYLVDKAEELGLRLFVLVGFQYAAQWFPDDWLGVNEQGNRGFIMNYEHPDVRAAYSNYIYQVTLRYKNRPVIGAWILGNEYSYFDLWNPTNRLYFGYDRFSVAAFQKYLAVHYSTNIDLLNTNWNTRYTSFEQVIMPPTYPSDRRDPRYYDLIQWRKHSIGELVAVGAVAARKADTNHLLSYSMIGGIFSGDDSSYTCEDEKIILQHCSDAGAPLNFWSVNNYAYTVEGAEMRAGDFGIAKYQELVGLPVLVTETGHSSTDAIFPEEQVRYAKALPTQLWEALLSGAMGVHVFTWNDRHVFGPGWFPRERGFGIVNQDRTIKDPVYWNVLETFRRMENLKLNLLLPGSENPPTDIDFFWSTNADMVWPRANQENAMLWGALRRLGYQPGIIDDDKFTAGAATNTRALILSRCWIMDPTQLDGILTNAISSGVNVFANADLPGQLDTYQRTNQTWTARMASFFGLDVSGAKPDYDEGVRGVEYLGRVNLQGITTLGPLTNGYVDHIGTWKVWRGIKPSSGTTIVTHTGNNGTQPPMPALQVKDLGTAKTAITTFALGDTYSGEPANNQVTPPEHQWDVRYTWLQAIFGTWFGLPPVIQLSGTNATWVLPDYRICSNGSALIALLNESTNSASVHLDAPSLLMGKTVENLTSGGILGTLSDGRVDVEMAGDDYVLLYAYDSSTPSLLNPTPNKIWLQSAPVAVYPDAGTWNLDVGLDLQDNDLSLGVSFERVLSPNITYARTNVGPVSGRGILTVPLFIPDSNPQDPWFVSSLAGGKYQFHVWLERGGIHVADSYLPVRLLWAATPLSLPETVVPGATVQVTLAWEELPSYLPEEGPTTLQRAEAWQPYKASSQYYKVVLELRSQGQVVATQEYPTDEATGQHTFTVTVPSNASGPFTWTTHLSHTPWASVDFLDGFEDRDGGNKTNGVDYIPLFTPWQCYPYSEHNNAVVLDYGVGTNYAFEGRQSAFLAVTNPADAGSYSGFGMWYTYPKPFSIPRNRSDRTNYAFSVEFLEESGLPCVLELELKDTNVPPGLIHFTKPYQGGGGYDKIEATLDQFEIVPFTGQSDPDFAGHFDPDHVASLVLNVQMISKPALYVAFFDDVKFIGPKVTTQIATPQDLWEGFDNRPIGDNPGFFLPWISYTYPPGPDQPGWISRGVGAGQGVDDSAAAFLRVTNYPGVTFSGFGLLHTFSSPWSLPNDRKSWANYSFSLDFRETSGLPCIMEMQVKDANENWIQFTNRYSREGGWNHIYATLDQFKQAPGVGDFDPKNVLTIVANIRMLQAGASYFGQFDNIFFDAPDVVVEPNEPWAGFYDSANDVPVPIQPFAVSVIEQSTAGVTLSWPARGDRAYSVLYQDDELVSAPGFLPVPGLSGLTSSTGRIVAADTNAPASIARFYRVVEQRL